MSIELFQQLQQQERRLYHLETQEALPIVARYTLTSLTVNHATLTRCNYATQVFDPWAAVTTGASWVFTAPIGGYYQVSAALGLAGSTGWVQGEAALLEVLVSGNLYGYLDMRNDIASAGWSINVLLHGSELVYVAKDGTIAVEVYQGSGGNLGVVNDAHYNYITIAKVG